MARKDILQNVNAYIELLEQHIQEEDELFYPMAEEKLSDRERTNCRTQPTELPYNKPDHPAVQGVYC